MKTKSKPYVLALDCGTTGNRAIVFDVNLRVKASSYHEFTQHFPKPGWVEHDAEEIWLSVKKALKSTLNKVPASKISSIGITNQRETIVVWNKKTGKPVMPAIVWQCRRSSDLCATLRKKSLEKKIHHKTGLFLDPYFSGSKIRWIIENKPKVKEGIIQGKFIIGTIDAWVIWKLTNGKSFSTDPTNASRTLLYDIRTGAWDKELCKLFKVPMGSLPEVLPSSFVRGVTSKKSIGCSMPIAGVAGDQQSSAYAQGCSPKGIVKNTYGTGLFVVADTGREVNVTDSLVTTVAASAHEDLRYALEGSVFIGGASMQWLRDSLGVIDKAADSQKIASKLKSNDGCYFVPALAGLGCPYWDSNARGLFIGITRQTTKAHFIRASLESMAYQTKDVLDVIKSKIDLPIKKLRVDGGAASNDWLMQFQADILGCEVIRPKIIETTALGAAALAGIATGIWEGQKDFIQYTKIDKVFKPKMTKKERDGLYSKWTDAVNRSRDWV